MVKSVKYFFYFIKEHQDLKYLINLGNHDTWKMNRFDVLNVYKNNLGQLYQKTMNQVYYEQEFDDVVYLMLNPEMKQRTVGFVSDKQLSWLKSRLEFYQASYKQVVIYCHRPL